MNDRAFEERLEAVLLAQISGCTALKSVDRLSGGASQETYRIVIDTSDGEQVLALRRAPGGTHSEVKTGRPGLAGEAALMTSAREAGVPAPEVYYVLAPSDALGDGFIMEWIEGEALGARIVRQPEYADLRTRLAYEAGEVLARIHAIDIQAAGLENFLTHIPPSDFIKQTWNRYVSYGTPQPMIDYVARWLIEQLPDQSDAVLVHNEFRTGNFMVDADDGIVAVLDWEVAHIGDPMRDLGWICTNSWRYGGDLPVGGFGDYEDLFAGYESVAEKKVDPEAVRFWQVFGSFWWSTTCLEMVNQFRHGVDASVERASIGRRTSEALVDCVNLIIPGPVELIPPAEDDSNLDTPRADELLGAVSGFLRDEVLPNTKGRMSFLARVSANAVDVAARETHLLAEHRLRETRSLQALLGTDEANLETLRWRLVHALRDGSQALADEALVVHLRNTVVNQVAIDQPHYSGLKQALEQ